MVLNIGKEKKQGKDWEGGCAVERDTHITIVIALLLNGGWGEEKKIYCFYRLLVPLLFSRCTSFFFWCFCRDRIYPSEPLVIV